MRKKALPDTRWIISILAGLFLLSVLITLFILLLSGRNELKTAADNGYYLSGVDAQRRLTRQDFLLEDDSRSRQTGIYPLRERLERWGDEQIDRFWIPLKGIALDIIKKENDKRIREIFKDIP